MSRRRDYELRWHTGTSVVVEAGGTASCNASRAHHVLLRNGGKERLLLVSSADCAADDVAEWQGEVAAAERSLDDEARP